MSATGIAKPKRSPRVGYGIAALALLATCCGVPCVLRVFFFGAFDIDGPAMEPTLLHGDRVIIDKVGDAAAGDVVIVRSPFDGIDMVKRVIGVGGDRVSIVEGEVLRNGETIRRRQDVPCVAPGGALDPDLQCSEERIGEHTWQTAESSLSVPDNLEELVVPAGHVFVLGDHRDRSNDSRNPRVGTIPVENIHGAVLYIYLAEGEGRAGTRVE